MQKKCISVFGRRQFLTEALPLGTLFCLGCKNLFGIPHVRLAQQAQTARPKYLDDSGMTVEAVYGFAYGTFIPYLQILAKNIGRDRFIEELKKASAENAIQLVASMAKDAQKRNMNDLAELVRNFMSVAPYNKAFAMEIAENTDKVLEMKYTVCLPAKIFRDMNAADLGYALECSGGAALAKSFNPKFRAENPKNLMKGDDICIERFVREA